MARHFENHAEAVINNLNRLAIVKSQRELRQSTKNRCDGSNEKDGITAIELGSGNGFLSVCLLALATNHRIRLKELVVTDFADHLPLMVNTLKANPHVWNHLRVIGVDDATATEAIENQTQTIGTAAIVAEHVWGEYPQNDHIIHNKKYDFIFGTDLAYRNSLHEPLIASLLHFSHEHTICLIGVTMNDTQPVFFDSLTKAGFRYEKLADHLLEKEFRGSNFGIIAIQRR